MLVDLKLVTLVKTTIENTFCQVRIHGELIEDFAVNRGLKQGDRLVPMLFNLAPDYAERKTS